MAGTMFWSFFVVILILVTIHEYGHYWVAKRCGVAIEKFSIGFGPTILTWTNQEGTEFVLAAIPLGGFVKMRGEYTIATSEQQTSQGTGSFAACSVWQRMAIVVAGPLVNLVFALILFTVLAYGRHEVPAPIVATPLATSLVAPLGLKSGDVIESINGKAVKGWGDISSQLLSAVFDHDKVELTWRSANGQTQQGAFETQSLNIENPDWFDAIGLNLQESALRLGEIKPGAAQLAGLQTGDEITQVDNQPVPNRQAFLDIVQKSAGKPIAFELNRAGQTINVTVTPKAEQQVVQKEGRQVEQTVGKIGAVILSYPTVTYDTNIFAALQHGAQQTIKMAWLNTKGLFKMLTGQMSLKSIGGPVSIAKATGEGAQNGLASFIWVLAVISVSLGALNLLPIPVLDGGHLVYYAFEAVMGRPVSDKALAIGQRFGLALLLCFMGIAFFNDARGLFG